MHTQKKLFGKIKINVIPAPAENSAKPNTRFMRSPPWLRPQKKPGACILYRMQTPGFHSLPICNLLYSSG